MQQISSARTIDTKKLGTKYDTQYKKHEVNIHDNN